MWGPAVDPRFEKLVAAVGEERYIEGRLTGGFKYGPLRSVARGPGDVSHQNLALLAVAAELETATRTDASATNLHAWGVAQVLLGRLDAAITSLGSALRERPTDSGILSDLAAAHLAKAKTEGSRGDAEASVQYATRALALAPGLSEALYNRAAAFEVLGDSESAAADFRALLAHEPPGGWRQSIEEHLRSLQAGPR
jgi:tetratricopeptide (TPR) repeat protein